MTRKRESSGTQAHWYLTVALLGLVIIPLITFSGNVSQAISSDQSLLVWSAFTLICVAGTIAGIRPSGCSGRSQTGKAYGEAEPRDSIGSGTGKVQRKGHHYICGHYSAHVFSVGGRVFCAGCTGLAIGGTIAAAGSLSYMMMGFSWGLGNAFFWLGSAGVAIGLLQHPIYRALSVQNALVRIIINVVFVNGAFLLLLGAHQLAQDFSLDAYLLIVIVFWILTRVVMSKSEHRRTCAVCPELSCAER